MAGISRSGEEVHHKNEDVLDDRLDNYELLTDVEHARLHAHVGTRRLDYDAIAALREEGLGYKRIAKRLGYARSSVRDACHRLESAA